MWNECVGFPHPTFLSASWCLSYEDGSHVACCCPLKAWRRAGGAPELLHGHLVEGRQQTRAAATEDTDAGVRRKPRGYLRHSRKGAVFVWAADGPQQTEPKLYIWLGWARRGWSRPSDDCRGAVTIRASHGWLADRISRRSRPHQQQCPAPVQHAQQKWAQLKLNSVRSHGRGPVSG